MIIFHKIPVMNYNLRLNELPGSFVLVGVVLSASSIGKRAFRLETLLNQLLRKCLRHLIEEFGTIWLFMLMLLGKSDN